MKHLKMLTLFSAILLTLLMGSCDALFSNKFQELGLGQVDSAALAEASSETLITQSGINSGTISQSFIDAALKDDTTKAAIVAELTTASTSGDPKVEQTAQALLIEIKLQDTGAKEVVSNMGGLLDLFTGDDQPDPSTAAGMNAIIDTLIPADMSDEDLVDVFNNLNLLANNEIADFGANLVANGGLQNDNIDTASIAQTAVLATVVEVLDPVAGYATIGEALVAALNNEDSAKDFGDFVTIPAGGLGDLTTDANLTAIFTAAGLGDLINQLGS
ncbi:MAG: hypothetical protein RBT73_11110 [Spirochaetia bacterium]|jgi:hypothetical protein|nr:hypothetical protein [Spirochaetia bacterium]